MEIHRAIIRRFDPVAWTADVELAGAPMALLAGVPVAANIGADLVTPGSRVWVLLSSEGNPADAVIFAV